MRLYYFHFHLKILRYYNYTGNHDDMCNALLEVFVERKNCDEASSSKTFSSRTLSTYVRLVKALLIAVNKEVFFCHQIHKIY